MSGGSRTRVEVGAPERVAVRWDTSMRGRVVLAGPEQTEVLLDGGQRTRVFVNSDLVRLIRRKRGRS